METRILAENVVDLGRVSIEKGDRVVGSRNEGTREVFVADAGVCEVLDVG